MSDPYLHVERLTKKFGVFTALDDIGLSVDKSELVCFLGPSGCGKTTLLRCIAGLEIPTTGKIVQNGVDITPLTPDKRDFGIVFQSYALFPNLTVHDNLAFGLKSMKLTNQQIEDRIDELIKTVGLEEQVNKYPAQLSGGQQQRTALARALATSPGLLLLDEPLSALDAKVRQHLRREILALQRMVGVTTILVTHDQEEALTMGDRIIVMDHGTIAQVGTAEEVYSSPNTPFVADFIGEMNFFDGVTISSREVRVGPLEFSSSNAKALPSSGTNVHVCIRPEDVELNGYRSGGIRENTTTATVVDCEFMGAVNRIRLTLDETADTELVAQVTPAELRSVNLSPGTRTTVVFPSERLHVYPR